MNSGEFNYHPPSESLKWKLLVTKNVQYVKQFNLGGHRGRINSFTQDQYLKGNIK